MNEVSDAFVQRLVLSNSAGDVTNDITFTDGLLATWTRTKRTDATFTAGDGGGGLDTGSVGNNWYHCFAIRKNVTGDIDYLFSLSPTAPTMPSGYDLERRVGAIQRTAGAIRLFVQFGEIFLWKTPIEDNNVGTLGTTATLFTLTVPTGLRVVALFVAVITKAAATPGVWVSVPDLTDVDVAATNIRNAYSQVASVAEYDEIEVLTNTSAQVRARATEANCTFATEILGWKEINNRRVV